MTNDLISRGALFTTIYENPESEGNARAAQLLEAIIKAPAVDAVEVVRCKDCMHRGNAYKCPMYFAHGHCDDEDRTEDEGFCVYGAKMDLED